MQRVRPTQATRLRSLILVIFLSKMIMNNQKVIKFYVIIVMMIMEVHICRFIAIQIRIFKMCNKMQLIRLKWNYQKMKLGTMCSWATTKISIWKSKLMSSVEHFLTRQLNWCFINSVIHMHSLFSIFLIIVQGISNAIIQPMRITHQMIRHWSRNLTSLSEKIKKKWKKYSKVDKAYPFWNQMIQFKFWNHINTSKIFNSPI